MVVADALIGGHWQVARDNWNDRQLFSDDSLNFVEGGATARGIGLAGLRRKQFVDSSLPCGRGLRLLRTPGIRGAAAAQHIGEAGRIRLNAEIFRAYDIRGIVGDSLTAEVVKQIGRAIGSEAFDRGEQKVVIARDGRCTGSPGFTIPTT